jgi:hypothetical protein
MFPEKYVEDSFRMRDSAQLNSIWTFVDKFESPQTVRATLKSNKYHVFTNAPLRRRVSRSTYTAPSSVAKSDIHSEYAGSLQSNRRITKKRLFMKKRRVLLHPTAWTLVEPKDSIIETMALDRRDKAIARQFSP